MDTGDLKISPNFEDIFFKKPAPHDDFHGPAPNMANFGESSILPTESAANTSKHFHPTQSLNNDLTPNEQFTHFLLSDNDHRNSLPTKPVKQVSVALDSPADTDTQNETSENPSKNEVELAKIEKNMKKYPLRPPCTDSCRFKCSQKISEKTRAQINASIVKMSWWDKRVWITNHVRDEKIKRRTTNSINSREHSYKYYMQNDEGVEIKVCKTFFLATLGYKNGNDSAIKNALKSVDNVTQLPQPDKRGKMRNTNSDALCALIENHIESYHPCVSHHRRINSLEKRYLPSDLTITDMHKDYNDKFPLNRISYERYRLSISRMNISFTKSDSEECDACEKFSHHDHGREDLHADCEECQEWSAHNVKVNRALQLFTAHVNEVYASASMDAAYFMADFQKVVLLPRMQNFSALKYAARMVVFNLGFTPLSNLHNTFTPLTNLHNTEKPVAVIWHEGIAGRKKEQIVSAFHSFFLVNRDRKKIVLWLDDCISQNKNWCLFSFFVYLVNSDEIEADFIELNYFENGHMFMPTESFLSQVESSMNKMGQLLDFRDFETSVRRANSGKSIVESLKPFDFCLWIDHSSSEKVEQFSSCYSMYDMKKVQFRRGSYNMAYSFSYDSGTLSELEFLESEIIENGFPPVESEKEYRGISHVKKEAILESLVPLMPRSRRQFWQKLVPSDVIDLVSHYEDE